MKQLLIFCFLLFAFFACDTPKKATVPTTVAVPVDTSVIVVFPEKTYHDSLPFWAWPTDVIGVSPLEGGKGGGSWTSDWPEATTTVAIHPPQGGTNGPAKIYVTTTCKERTDTVRIRDTIMVEAPCPERPSQTTGHGKGWLLAAAFAFVFLMTLFAEKRKK